MALTLEQAEADIAFLLARSASAGSVNFMPGRWTGMSSNALVALAYGGEQTAMPSDRADYAACVRTFWRLPKHRKTADVRAGLKIARDAYLANYPGDRFPGPRNAEAAKWKAEWEARKPKRRRRRA